MKRNVRKTFSLFLSLGAFIFMIQLSSYKSKDHKKDEVPSLTAAEDPESKDLQDKCTWIDAMAKKYRDRVNSRIQGLVNKNHNFRDTLPIETYFADTYMRSFRNNLSGPWSNTNTHTVSISTEEIAYFIDYLYKHKNEKSIVFAFARYDIGLLGSNTDTDLQARASDFDRRYTLIAGLAPKTTPVKPPQGGYLDPFVEGTKTFYDDWHDIWP